MTVTVKFNRTILETKIGGSTPSQSVDRFIAALTALNSYPEASDEGITVTAVNDTVGITDETVKIIPTYTTTAEDFNVSLSNQWGIYFLKIFNDFNITPVN